jgi:hypothetical protein
VIAGGKLSAPRLTADTDEAEIGLMMAGAKG